MEEKINAEGLLSAMMGGESMDALRMIERMNRLKKLLGAQEGAKMPDAPKIAETSKADTSAVISAPFGNTVGEKILTASIPFLDQEYQREIFVVVRLMEMRRVLESTYLEAREKQEESGFRRHNMLRAVRSYLPTEERGRLDTVLKMMEMKEILDRGEGR